MYIQRETARNAVSTHGPRVQQSGRYGRYRYAKSTGDRCFRSKEFYVLGVPHSEHSRAALTPHTCHRQLFGAAQSLHPPRQSRVGGPEGVGDWLGTSPRPPRRDGIPCRLSTPITENRFLCPFYKSYNMQMNGWLRRAQLLGQGEQT